jgi:hypothetical protein
MISITFLMEQVDDEVRKTIITSLDRLYVAAKAIRFIVIAH